MSSTPDLTLPPTAPVDRYHDEPENLLPMALYTLVDLSDEELQQLQDNCESECESEEPGDNVRLAPTPRFVNQPLRAVYDSHLELGAQKTYNPIYFAVAIHQDWRQRGVLLVASDDDDLTCHTDSFRIKASDAGLSFVNLQIGNSDWASEKECYTLPTDGEEGSSDDDGNGEALSASDPEDYESDSGPEFPLKKPVYDYYAPLYVMDGVDSEKLIYTSLEPGASYSKEDRFQDYFVRTQASLHLSSNATTENLNQVVSSRTNDLVSQACVLHPVRCRKNPWLHKTLLIVCDTTNPGEQGLVIVRLSWDGITKGRSKAQLRQLGQEASRETQRMPCSVEGIQYKFCNLAAGIRVWAVTHPLVAVFEYNDNGRGFSFSQKLLDKKAAKRKEGDECLTYGPYSYVPEDEFQPVVIKWSFDEAVRRFPWFCRQLRFNQNFTHEYFICVDGNSLKEAGVTIVRMDWDGNMNKSEDELLNLPSKDWVSTLNVKPNDAFKLVQAAIEGTSNGMDEETVGFFRLGQ